MHACTTISDIAMPTLRTRYANRRAPPKGWGATVDLRTGKPYYWHLESGRTTWFYPAPLPDVEPPRAAKPRGLLAQDEHSALLRIAAREAVRYTRSLAREATQEGVGGRAISLLARAEAAPAPQSTGTLTRAAACRAGDEVQQPRARAPVLASNPFFAATTALPTWPLPSQGTSEAASSKVRGVEACTKEADANVASEPSAEDMFSGAYDVTESAMAKLAVRNAVRRLPPAPSSAPQQRVGAHSSRAFATNNQAMPAVSQCEDAVQEWGTDLALMLGQVS